jgi:hypothetical protein
MIDINLEHWYLYSVVGIGATSWHGVLSQTNQCKFQHCSLFVLEKQVTAWIDSSEPFYEIVHSRTKRATLAERNLAAKRLLHG